MKTLVFIILTLSPFLVYSQSSDQVFEQLNKMRQEMMKQMQANDSFDSEIQQMFERMRKLGQIQGPSSDFFGPRGSGGLEYSWKDARTLVINVSKDDEVDIDVKKGMVTISGMRVSKTKNSFSKHSFSQSIAIDQSLDTSSVDMKMVDGNIVLKFKEVTNKKNI